MQGLTFVHINLLLMVAAARKDILIGWAWDFVGIIFKSIFYGRINEQNVYGYIRSFKTFCDNRKIHIFFVYLYVKTNYQFICRERKFISWHPKSQNFIYDNL